MDSLAIDVGRATKIVIAQDKLKAEARATAQALRPDKCPEQPYTPTYTPPPNIIKEPKQEDTQYGVFDSMD